MGGGQGLASESTTTRATPASRVSPSAGIFYENSLRSEKEGRSLSQGEAGVVRLQRCQSPEGRPLPNRK